ncbi:MAG: hypothetical protein D4R90_03250 [Nitrosopumilales archaeon]|nr:MAG: hypothetical protein D4R90_03250 [Nitrosopumilales archaeon]
MKSKKYVYLGIIGVAIAAVVIAITQFNIIPMMDEDKPQQSSQVAFLDFSYDEANSDIKSTLVAYHINMTKPIRLSSQADVRQYCNFLTDPKKQALVTYCTSTVLKDKQGFLGNVNMLGSTNVPGIVVVALQSNPMLTNYGAVKTVFDVVINSTICQCWEKETPDGFLTLSALVDKLRDTHLTTKDPTTSTHVLPLGNKHFKIELTTNESGYLWKLLVSK